jgi:hypothetical protein
MNVQSACRSFDFKWFDNLPSSTLDQIRQGADMVRINFDSKVVPECVPSELRELQRGHSRRWLAECGLPVSTFRPLLDVDFDLAPGPRVDTAASLSATRSFETIAAAQSGQRDFGPYSVIVTCEDKDPSVLWSESLQGGVGRWLGLLGSQSRWRVINVPGAAVLSMYRAILGACLPKSMLPDNMSMQYDNLPYAYYSVKRKCFRGMAQGTTGGGGVHVGMHTCSKEGHSCLRNIF